MSLRYGTDKAILENQYDGLDLDIINAFPWHQLYNEVDHNKVTDAHFRRFLTESKNFRERDAVLFDCYKAGILKAQTVYDFEISNENEDLEGERLHCHYTIDARSPKAKDLMRKLILSEIPKDAVYRRDLADEAKTLITGILRRHEIEDAEDILDVAAEGIEAGVRNRLNPDLQKQKLDDTVRDALTAHPEEKEAKGEQVINDLKGAIYSHRNRSAFYRIFHPINYYREGKSIEAAKQALVTLGADKDKVDRFERSVIEEDRALRDAKNPERAEELGKEIGLTFGDLKPAPEVPAEEPKPAYEKVEDDLDDSLEFYDTLEKKVVGEKEKETERVAEVSASLNKEQELGSSEKKTDLDDHGLDF